MKNKTTKIASVALGVTTTIALCMAFPVCSGTSAYAKPSHSGGGKPGGGSSGGGSTNIFYPTVTNVSQLIGDINYANQIGGTYTIYLQPNTTFTSGALGI